MLKRFILSLSIFCLTFTNALFVQAKDNNAPIDLTADEGVYDQQSNRATYSGNVRVKQGGATLYADKLVIFLSPDQSAERLEAEGKKSPVKLEYKGDKQPIKGQGQRVVYRVKENLVVLSGNAKITQGSDTISGNQLSYHLDKEVIGGQRVKMTFKPKN